ncbi:MAG: biotin/lipoyl-containing protein [Gemmatimonadota bacterium]
MKYVVTVGDREFVVDIDGQSVRLDGTVIEAQLDRLGDSPEYRIAMGTTHRTFAVDQRIEDGWALVLDGTVHEVGILDARTRHIRSLSGASAAASGTASIKAPMPGLLVKRLVEVGDDVAEGQGLVVLEAMKMENELRAPIAGRVTVLHGLPGEAIKKGQVLVQLAQPE